tara:strand:+ start:152 stop:499 length:348 start_codon:yes stop_codon:yes gene_type:complete
MAYSRVTLNKKEKQMIGVALLLAFIPFVNNLFPAVRNFWTNTLGVAGEMVDGVGESVGLVAVGYAVLKVSKFTPGYFRVIGMLFGYGLILSGVVPYLFKGQSLRQLLNRGQQANG